MAIFEGAGVAIITPFHTDGSIDYDKFGEVMNSRSQIRQTRSLCAAQPVNLRR